MKKKYKISIIIALAFLLLLVTLITVRHHINKNKDFVKIVVKNGLSINYLNGDIISTTSNKSVMYTFSITNNSDKENHYMVNLDPFKSDKKITYTLSCEETNTNREGDFSSEKIVDYAVINPGETHNYVLKINKYPSKKEVGTLVVEDYTFETEYFAQSIIANSNLKQSSATTVGTEISTTDEGLIQDLDDDGVTYYFRGNVQNNYVKFADMTWRIVRINGNNTVRLVLNDQAEELTEYYLETSNNYFAYNNTNIKIFLSNWYNEKLSSYDKYIVTSKVCDNTAYTGDQDYVFAASQRLTVDHNPTFNCLGTKVNSKISLLTADEVEYAGALIGVGNTSYYLYNSNILNPAWTMTPSKGNQSEFYPYAISNSGSLDDTSIGNTKRSVRPVINIRKDIAVTGKGTIDEPYELLF